jgi:protein phosphatase
MPGLRLALATELPDVEAAAWNAGMSKYDLLHPLHYLLNHEKGAIQLTKDHTFVQELVDKGMITNEEARQHPKKSVLNQAVGTFADIAVDTFSRRLNDNDYVLLCCDGLINHVSDDEMAKIVLDNIASPQEACDILVKKANERGGKDNVSVIVTPANIMKQ